MRAKIFTILFVVLFLVGCARTKEESASSLSPTITPTPTQQIIVEKSEQPNISKKNADKLTIGNTSSNLAMGGHITTDSEWHYFNPMNTDQPGKLGKMKKDGGEVIILSQDKPWFINVSNDWIYYIAEKEELGVGSICRIKKDGTQRSELFSQKSSNLVLVGEYLYFTNWSDDNSIYKIKTDGTELEKVINKQCSRFIYDNKFIYVIDIENTLYKYSIDNLSNPVQVTKNILIGDWVTVSIFKDNIYFTNDDDDYIYEVDCKGNEIAKISGSIYDTFAISNDGNIYLPMEGKDDIILSLYRYEISSGQMFKITENNHVYDILGTADEYIYFSDSISEDVSKIVRLKKDGSNNTGNKALDIDFIY